MANTIFPLPVADSNAKALTIPLANTMYRATTSTPAGVYTITCPSGTIAKVKFFNGLTEIVEVATVSGTISYNLGTASTSLQVYTNTGTDVVVTITKTADALTGISGTLDTLTTSQTYNQTGTVWVVVVGGGGAGGGTNGSNTTGGGGGGGGIWTALTTLNTSTTVTIGAGGNGVSTASGNAGGATTFGNLTANGGGGGTGVNGTAGAAGTGNTGGNSANGGLGHPNANVATDGGGNSQPYLFVRAGNNGGGGGGTDGSKGGGGSVIGTGGTSAENPTNASGYGAGGWGRRSMIAGGAGGNGTPGVVYVLRGLF